MTFAHSLRRTLAAALLLGMLVVPFARAGTIWTLDGKTYEGDTKLDIPDGLIVTPKGGKPEKIPLNNLLLASLTPPQFSQGVGPGSLPGELRGRDIGNVAKPGMVNFLQGTFTIKASGTEANRLNDAFHFTYVPFNGDGSIVARVVELAPAQKDTTAKSGIMFRSTLEPTTMFASLMVNQEGLIEFRCRTNDRGEALVGSTRTGKLPVWLRLIRTRNGNDSVFIAECSEDGRFWNLVGRNEARAPADIIRRPPNVGGGVGGRRGGVAFGPAVMPTTLPATRPATAPATAPVVVLPVTTFLTFLPKIPMGFGCSAGIVTVGGSSGQPASATVDSFTIRENSRPEIKTDADTTAAAATFISMPIESVGRGILLKSGSYFANAELIGADSRNLNFTYTGIKLSVPFTQVSRMNMEPLTPNLAARIPSDRMGILSRNGDFMEGEISAFNLASSPRTVTLSSVIFGLTNFTINDGTTSSIIFREPSPADAAYRIVMIDGSVLLAESIKAEADRLLINERTVGKMALPINQVYVIRAAAEHASSLAALKPSKVEGPENFDPAAISLFDKTQWTWLILPGGPSPGGIVSPAATTITYDLGGKAKSFVCRIGVPERVPPRNAARFSILVDGQLRYQSKALTSKDLAITIPPIPLLKANTLTLKLDADSDTPQTTFGLWGDPMLIK